MSDEPKATSLRLTVHQLELLKDEVKATDDVARAARREGSLPAEEADEIRGVAEWVSGRVDGLIARIEAQIPPE